MLPIAENKKPDKCLASVCADGGTRTHKPLRAIAFEAIMFASFITSAY
jgi:hypothetical protein